MKKQSLVLETDKQRESRCAVPEGRCPAGTLLLDSWAVCFCFPVHLGSDRMSPQPRKVSDRKLAPETSARLFCTANHTVLVSPSDLADPWM